MTSDGPDYTRYSLDDLLDAQRHIDVEQYPERYRQLCAEIEKRRNEPERPPPEAPPPPAEPAADVAGSRGFWVGILIASVVVVGLGVFAAVNWIVPAFRDLSEELGPVMAEISRAYPEQTCRITVQGNPPDERELVFTLTDSSWARLEEPERKERVIEFAALGFAAYPKADEISTITVVFQEKSSTGPVTMTNVGETYRFSPSELREVTFREDA